MIATARLELVPATAQLAQAAIGGAQALKTALDVEVPASWPPEYADSASFQFALDKLAKGSEQAGWWTHLVLLRSPRTLIGVVGYKGPPSADGTVEVGYGIVSDHQRKGYASEAVRGLVSHAFSVPAVRRVIAETLPTLAPSIGVLKKCGFVKLDVPGSEPGVIRFELIRP